jgi:hypothetical protein
MKDKIIKAFHMLETCDVFMTFNVYDVNGAVKHGHILKC